jgi:hypothetical protein
VKVDKRRIDENKFEVKSVLLTLTIDDNQQFLTKIGGNN